MRFVGYIRVSRVAGREGDSFISPAVQRERIEHYLASQGHTLVDWAEDLDQPGSKYERPAFQRALAAVEAGEADGIAVAAIDRFARSVADAAIALRRLEQAGAALISVRDTLDTTTSVGRFARTMMLALAELELDRTRENWRTAREHAIGRGVHIARTPIFGYQRRDDGGLEPDPETARIVRELFRRRAAGEEWRSLARWLDEASPRENGVWIASSVRSIVRSRTYLGEARSGDITNPTAHPPLVPRALWEAAQENRPSSNRRGESEPALLAGLVRCAACRYVAPRSAHRHSGNPGYKCHGTHATGRCPQPSRISEPLLDSYVERIFLEEIARSPVEADGVTSTTTLDAAVVRLEQAEAELAVYRDSTVLTAIGKPAFVAGLQKRAADVEAARVEVAREQSTRESSVGKIGRRGLLAAWPTLSPGERREYLAAAIDAVFIRRGDPRSRGDRVDVAPRVHIAWRGEAPLATLPGRGRRLPTGPFVFPDELPDDVRVRAA
jgi:site-specific DNA recombinase